MPFGYGYLEETFRWKQVRIEVVEPPEVQKTPEELVADVIGKARGYLTTLLKWQNSGKKKGKPGIPTASNHPTLYAGTFTLELGALDMRKSFIRLKVYTGEAWMWVHYPTVYNRYFDRRRAEPGWET